ncbi:MAG: hypothetical protein QM708_13955 [Propioniciclava sp.]|uniref:hypothetical protein n=1 Tax=Propioniciclava sp. TaxID=2038686 RepID=UPI0039E33D46
MALRTHDLSSSHDSRRSADWMVTGGAGLLGTAAVAALAANGIITGIPALLIGAVALVLIPSVRHLSGRVFVNGVLLCAIAYLTWMIPLPPIGITRGGLLLSVMAGLVCGAIAARRRGLTRVRVLPAVADVDAVMAVLATITSLASLTYWLRAWTPELAYGLLTGPWDNSSHYSMVMVMHRYQNILFNLGPSADGTPYSFYTYPAGYHAVAASVMDLLAGTPGPHPVAFVMTAAIVLAGGYFIVAAGIANLPVIRRAGVWGYFAISVGVGVLGFGPGMIAPSDGHYNFSFAIIMVIAASLAAIRMRRLFNPLQASTVLAAALCAGGAWLPMGMLAAGLSLIALVPWQRNRLVGTTAERAWVGLVALVVLAATVVTIASQYMLGTTVGHLATAGGGLVAASAVLPPTTAALLGLLSLAIRTPDSRIAQRPSVRRAAWISLLLMGLIVVYSVVEAIIVTYAGQARPSYYPQKALNGITTVAMVIAGVMMAIVASDRVPLPGTRPSSRRAIAALMCTIGILPLALSHTTIFSRNGLGDTSARVFGGLPARPDLVAACHAALKVPVHQAAIIASGRETDTLICADGRGTQSWETWDINEVTKKLTGHELVRAARPWLDGGTAVLVVAPESLDRYRRLVGTGSDQKVIAWEDPPARR